MTQIPRAAEGRFMGNPEHLEQFLRLLRSPLRSDAREAALQDWEAYNRAQQALVQRRQDQSKGHGKVGRWTKGEYVRSLNAPGIDLRGATFTDVCVGYADLRGVRFDHATFTHEQRAWSALKGAKLAFASLKHASLVGMRLMSADLQGADLTGADLTGADLSEANLAGAVLRGATLTGADLRGANLVRADVEGCRLDGCRVYGVAAWDLRGRPESSRDLVITPAGGPPVTADDISVAQFVYLMINNPAIRDVLDTVTRKVVLLLGRFQPERKAVLDSLRDALRQRNFVPVLFDFDCPADRDFTETVTLLARMARFVVADLTEPASIPQELQAIAHHVEVPIRLIIAEPHRTYAMSKDLRKYPWVIPPFRYRDATHLLASVDTEVVSVAEAKRVEIERDRADPSW